MVAREVFVPSEQPMTFTVSPLNWVVVSLCAAAVLALGLWPGWLV